MNTPLRKRMGYPEMRPEDAGEHGDVENGGIWCRKRRHAPAREISGGLSSGACGGGRRRRKVGFADRESLNTVVGRVFQENSGNEGGIGTVTLGLKT